MIRSILPNDLDQLKRIHEKFYSNEFAFPDFLNKYLCAFSVVDDNDNIISTGGVRLILESVIITDQDLSPRKRMKALYEILTASQFVAQNNGFHTLNAFVDNEIWRKHLMKIGFKKYEVVQLEF